MNTTLEIQEKRISARRALRLGLGREQLGQRGGPDGLVAALCPRSARASALRALSAPRARSAPAQLASGAPRRMYSVCVPALRAFLNTVFRLLGDLSVNSCICIQHLGWWGGLTLPQKKQNGTVR